MSEGNKSGVFLAIVIATLLSLIVTGVRLVGELQGWAPSVFNRAAGGGGSWLGITWLVPLFGFWFGRSLAKGGSRPGSTGRAILLPIVGMAIVAGMFWYFSPGAGEGGQDATLSADEWRTRILVMMGIAAAAGLTMLAAWPRAWFMLVVYGYLARLPVAAIQYFAIDKGWDTHFAKGAPNVPQEVTLYGLTMAQCVFWPLGFTTLVGGLFAAFGAATVKKG